MAAGSTAKERRRSTRDDRWVRAALGALLVLAAGCGDGGSDDGDDPVAAGAADESPSSSTSSTQVDGGADGAASTAEEASAAASSSAASSSATSSTVGGCPGQTGPASVASTPEELFAVAATAWSCAGHILHVVEEIGGGDGPTRREVWVDVAADAARVETSGIPSLPGGGHQRELTVDGVRYVLPLTSPEQVVDLQGVAGDPVRCFEGTAAVAAVLGCPGGSGLSDRTEEAIVTAEGGAADVAYVVTVQGQGTSEAGDVRTTTTRLLDVATLLPVSYEEESEVHWADGEVEMQQVRATVVAAFVPATDVPPWIFDPAALGRPGAGAGGVLDSLAAAAAPTAVYWLGERWEPGGGLPAADLGTIQPGFPDQDAGVLAYHSEDDDAHRVELRIVPVDVWGTGLWADPTSRLGPVCEGPTTLPNGASLTVHCSTQQDGTLADGGAAVVEFPDAIVLIGEIYVTTGQPSPTLPESWPLVTRAVARQIAAALVRYPVPD
jgi:hypothetical protein